MRIRSILALFLALLMLPGIVAAESITWHEAGEEVTPRSNPLTYSIQRVWLGTLDGQRYLCMEAELTAAASPATVALNDFVAMTRQDDVFYPAYAQTEDKAVSITESEPLTISSNESFTLTFVFPVDQGVTDFILVYRNAKAGDFYAVNASFGQKTAEKSEEDSDDQVYTGVPPALSASRAHANETPANQPAQTSGSSKGSIEEKIRSALQNHSSFLFKISDDHVFDSGTSGSISVKNDSGLSSSNQSTKWAQDKIKSWSKDTVIRIDNGKVTMEESKYYDCVLKILDNGAGISLHITTHDANAFDSEITGTIKGSTLTASQSVATATYSSYASLGLGNSFSGNYRVSLMEIPSNKWPPKPAVLSYSMATGGSWGDTILSVTLTWQDDNPPGDVKYYEIYKQKGVSGDYDKVATVSNGNTWVDEAPGTLWDMFSYYVIVYNNAGIPSISSNYCTF
jgi:hypothetical protein